MDRQQFNTNLRLLALLLAMAGVLAGCLGERYQAPISEQGEVMDQSGPEIVVNSDDSPSRYVRTPAGRVSASAGTAVTSGARVSTNPVSAAGSVSTTRAVSASGRPALHRVASGESLYSIAFQYDLDFRSLAIANSLTPPYTIFTGQELSLDINRPAAPAVAGETAGAAIGRVVENNSIAQAQAAVPTARGVIRQPISRSAIQAEPVWQWPLDGRVLTGFQADTSTRKGIDIAAVDGQPVNAAAAGEVVYAGSGIQGSGNLVIVRHNERLLSAYAHNRTMLVNAGERIQAGQQIGEAGVNGEGVPMLHFEIRLDGKPVDPLTYLPRQ